MKSIGKAHLKSRDEHIETLESARGQLDEAITEYNKITQDAFDALESKVQALTDAVSDAKTFTEEVSSDIQSYMDERSDKWHEGEKGQQFDEWRTQWEQFEFGEVELERPEELEMPEIDIEGFGNLPDVW